MQTETRKGLLAAAVIGSVACWSGAASAGDDDINSVFAEMTELPEATLQQANGRGAVDETAEGAMQSAVVSISGATIEPAQNGTENGATMQMVLPETTCGTCTNNLGDAFAGASAVAAITQNNGSNNAINNLVLVETHMHQ